MKIVHFADLHLDAQFAWAGVGSDAARRRRQGLRDALGRIAELVKETAADALFCGGDLYENDRIAPDTAEFLRATFAELDPVRVFLAPGNHDWYGPQSLYAVVEWSPNVHVFAEPRLVPVRIDTDLTLWGGAHCVPANTGNFLEGFRAEGPGGHIALFHGSERTWLSAQGNDKQPHAPFDASDIESASLEHAFLGHYHVPRDADRHTYPGNPEPLAFGEDGERGAVIATIDTGEVLRERREVAGGSVHDLTLDITGCATREQVRERLDKAVDGLSGLVRLTVSGEIDRRVELHENELRDVLLARFEAARIRRGELRAGYDLDAIRHENTVRGQFVNDVLDADLPEDERRRVLMTGLRALDGRGDLEVL
ncbi:MAG: metallophosphoesterase [Gammaproteobacteria bacterium]|nr:metallophosphoesterase [Gammaproteobacteria bacterium]